jgi:hypothetical protein
MKFILPLLLLLSQFAFAGANPVLQNQFTTNAAGTTLGLITATNFTSTAVGQTNVFDVTLFTNGVNAWTSSIDTNTAAINTASAATGSYNVTTIYTNSGQRALLTGSFVIPANSTAGGSGCVLRYTNNGVGYALPIGLAHANGSSGQDIVPFSVMLSTNATFKLETNAANSAGIYVTNVVLWRL